MKQYLPLWIRLVSLCLIFQLHFSAQSRKIIDIVKDDNANFLPAASVGLNDLVVAGTIA
ncbi:hypothetical protein [Chitinophaga sp.]|uniref:hypothetical protein n=1 Tax=Chitinophaga sp. TaxID=1869181 RepID=UPI002F93712E